MNSDQLSDPRDRKHAERAERRNLARTYTRKHGLRMQEPAGYSVECPRCYAQPTCICEEQEITCDNCGELIRL